MHRAITPCQIGILLFDGVEELDVVGPWEVLAYWTQHHPEEGWATSCLSGDGLIHPGGRGTQRLVRDPRHLDWVRAQTSTVRLMTSVSAGNLVYAAAGLLTGRSAPTRRYDRAPPIRKFRQGILPIKVVALD